MEDFKPRVEQGKAPDPGGKILRLLLEGAGKPLRFGGVDGGRLGGHTVRLPPA